jgi:hypothetical protein
MPRRAAAALFVPFILRSSSGAPLRERGRWLDSLDADRAKGAPPIGQARAAR